MLLLLSTLCAGLFTGAAVYVTDALLQRWGVLHNVRTIVSLTAFALLLVARP